MGNNMLKMEDEINVKEVLWKLVEQWKTVLIIAVVFALLCSSCMYIRAMKDYSIAQQSKNQGNQELVQDIIENPYTEKDIEALVEEKLRSLPEADREAVRVALKAKDSYDDLQKYLSQSVLMKLDPSDRHILHMEYSITVPEEDNLSLQLLTSAYSSILYAPLVDILRTELNSDIENQYIKELIDVKTKRDISDIQLSSTMTIEVTVPEEIDVTAFSTEVDQVVNNKANQLSESMCQHSVILFDNEDYTKVDYDLMTRQTDCLQRYTNLTNNLTVLENALSTEQKDIYLALQSQLSGNLSDYQSQTTSATQEDVIEKPNLSIKWGVVGFVLGIVVYLVLCVLYMILRPRIRSKGELYNSWNFRVIGEVYQYSQKGIRRFVNSKLFFNIHHRGKTDLEKQVNNLVNSLESLCRHMNIESVSFFPVAVSKDIDNYTLWNVTWAKMVECLQNKDLSVSSVKTFLAVDEMDERILAEARCAIPVVFGDVSSRQMLNNLILNANVYDVNLLGAVFIQQ